MLTSGSDLLRRSVVFRGVRLGEVDDVLLDATGRRVLGLAVRCGDGALRMLPLAAADLDAEDDTVGVSSALVLMDDAFYRRRCRTLTGVEGSPVRRAAATLGTLVDIRFDENGSVSRLVLAGGDEVPADGDLAIGAEARAAAN